MNEPSKSVLKKRKLSGHPSSWLKVAVMFARRPQMLHRHTVRVGLNNTSSSMAVAKNEVDRLPATGELKDKTGLNLRHEGETLKI